MAQVARNAPLQSKIDDYLEYLIEAWQGIPTIVAEWSDWDDHSQLVFAIDWAVPADRLQQVQQWAAEGSLTRAQRTRFAVLQSMVSTHARKLAELLAD